MPNRHEAIPPAHAATFEWVFDQHYHSSTDQALTGRSNNGSVAQNDLIDGVRPSEQNCSFLTWLDGSAKLYWVTGKPGAGKSTLMKFMLNHRKTQQSAQKWMATSLDSDDKPTALPMKNDVRLHTAAYFFWNPGTSMQKSKFGFCRTMLSQLLDDQPHLVPSAFPERWHRSISYGGDKRPFSWSELWEALRIALNNPNRRYLLFIDGLDEIDERPDDLARLVLELAQAPTVKVCAASRAWLEFEDAFHNVPRFYIEDLTLADIGIYVVERLNESRAFSNLRRYNENKAQQIIRDVKSRASGVFLWVYVVVESLLEGLRDGDSLLQLEVRLHELPTELNDLFGRILDQVSPRYAKEASELFRLVRKHSDQTTLLTLCYAQEDLDTVLHADVSAVEEEQVDYDLERVRRRIYSRCKCLLQVKVPYKRSQTVNYLHRTVRDYLLPPDRWATICGRSMDFDPDRAIIASYIAQVKQRIAIPELEASYTEQWNLCLIRAAILIVKLDSATNEEKVTLLDEIERTRQMVQEAERQREMISMSSSFGVYSLHRQGIYSISQRDSWPWGPKMKVIEHIPADWQWAIDSPASTFEFALGAGLEWYIEAKCMEEPNLLVSNNDAGKVPLLVATELQLWNIVGALLDVGADPNHGAPLLTTPFTAFLCLVQTALKQRSIPHAVKVHYLGLLVAFVEKGARPAPATGPDIDPKKIIAEFLEVCSKNKNLKKRCDFVSEKIKPREGEEKPKKLFSFKRARR